MLNRYQFFMKTHSDSFQNTSGFFVLPVKVNATDMVINNAKAISISSLTTVVSLLTHRSINVPRRHESNLAAYRTGYNVAITCNLRAKCIL